MKLLFCGDMAFTKSTGKSTIISNEMQKLMSQYDLVCVNFEAAMEDKTYKPSKIGPSIIMDDLMCNAIKNCKFDLFCLANNHIMDQGFGGLNRIKRTFAEIDMIGADENSELAYAPFIWENSGSTVGILNIAENGFGACISDDVGGYAWFKKNCIREKILSLKKKCDVLIIVVHAGAENWDFPLPEIREMYRQYVDWGVDIVIGHHPHTPQGWERYKESWIYYSLGNFAFYEGENVKNHAHSVCASVEVVNGNITCSPVYTVFENNVVNICRDTEFIIHMDRCNEVLHNESEYIKEVNNQVLNEYENLVKEYYCQVNGMYLKKTPVNYVKSFIKRHLWKRSFDNRWLYHNLMIETHLWVARRALMLKMCDDEV